MSQREDDTPSHIATRAIMHAKHGGKMSGGRISGFESGWALFGMGFGKAHHATLERGSNVIEAACGLLWIYDEIVFAPGNWPHCKTCARKVR